MIASALRTMRSRLPPFGLLRTLLCVFCAANTCPVGKAEIVTEFDTSTGGFQITCDPTELPALCAFDETYMRYVISGSAGDNNPIVTGIVKFSRGSDKFAAENCVEENCSFLCDGACSCATGTIPSGPGGFQPDGNSCTILSSNPGTIPTSQPTDVPTASPTFDLTSAIMYNATEMIEPSVLRVRCGGNMPIPGSYCKQVSGDMRYTIQEIDNYGWSNCDQNGDDCVVSCSPECTCEVATLNDYKVPYGRGYNDTVPTTPCDIIVPTPAPTAMPTEAPSEERPTSTSSAGSVGICVFMYMMMTIGMFATFL